jgi:GxxExxY protein
MEYLYTDLTEKIIKAFYIVYNTLYYRFLEKVYENAMMIELKSMGLNCEKQKPINVQYKSLKVGDYFADIIVNDLVIIELKAAEGLIEEHEAQLVNYRKATQIEVGLLLNFGKTPQIKRKVFENQFKSVGSVLSACYYFIIQ